MKDELPYVVLADDDPDDHELFCSAMRRYYPQINVRTFLDGDELLAFLENCTAANLPVFILLDYKMLRVSAPQVLQLTGAETRYGGIPKIVWSASDREKDCDECLRLGAIRFVTKPDSGRLLDNLMNSLGIWL